MKFRACVEPPEPMRGLEVPPEVVEALGGAKRPAVTITINGHAWKSRVAIMRGRYLLGLSNANRKAAGVVTCDEVEVEVEVDAEPRVLVEPPDFARALDADRSPAPPTTACQTAASGSRCSSSRARRRTRRAYGGSRRLWQRYGTRSRQGAVRRRRRPLASSRLHDPMVRHGGGLRRSHVMAVVQLCCAARLKAMRPPTRTCAGP